MARSLINEKIQQAVGILRELDIDCWLTFVRETAECGDPVLPLILGQPLTWQSALIVTKAGETIAIVGRHDDHSVRKAGEGQAWRKVLPYVQSIRSPLTTTLGRLDPRRIAVNHSVDDVKADGLSHGMMLLLREYLTGTPFVERLVSASGIIGRLRGRKSPAEIACIRRAVAVAEEIINIVPGRAGLGVSEQTIADLMHAEADRRNVQTAWAREQCPIVSTGPRSDVGHAEPSPDLLVTAGNILHVDFGVRVDGYCSDIQRCWYVPKSGETASPPALQRGFEAVAGAIRAAFSALGPGVPGWKVDEVARKALMDAGFPEHQHATGHMVGRAAHDGGVVLGPKWERYGQAPMRELEAGNVVTLELGIEDLDGRGCLGLEEMALVTERGAEWLSVPQTSLWLLR